MIKKTLISVLLLSSSTAIAQDTTQSPLPAVPDALKDQYRMVGKGPQCLNTARIRETQVLDDNTILFEMRGGADYLNVMERPCPRLGFQRSFAYTARANQLCDLDLITVLDLPANLPGPTCGLGPYYELAEIDETADEDKPDETR